METICNEEEETTGNSVTTRIDAFAALFKAADKAVCAGIPPRWAAGFIEECMVDYSATDGNRRHAAHPETHGWDVAGATRNPDVGDCRVSRHDDRNR
jgi:hypothetical protein